MSLAHAELIRPWLDRLQIRSGLAAEERDAVLALPGTVEEVASGRDVVRLGECVERACLVVEGAVARFGQTKEGLRQLSAIYIPGDMADLHSVVLPRSSSALQAIANSRVLRVPHSAVRDLVERYPNLAVAFWRDCVADAQVAAEWVVAIGRLRAIERIAHLICELALRYERIGAGRTEIPFEMTQVHLADATGMTSVHANRALRELRETGLVEIRNRRAHILGWPALTGVGNFDPAYLHLELADTCKANAA